ncbi:2-haloacid dehalogenase [Sphingomonas jejuensis]|uniref:2-haloacid dehalogenase n=1 Tax=Sphingomonas jejuensis TaxID=904715 RepID=A0ABX0XMC9_9SPHN|nr:HAD family phosphatase [Sphingomonas jejuensis]NJC34529.1 2-haloacid dehalogenase [Sphingomonas jejuensis]
MAEGDRPLPGTGERVFDVRGVSAVVFDVGNVLLPWDRRALYRGMIADEDALDLFLSEVLTEEWHFQHDAGRPFAETSAELIAEHPQHRALIEVWGPRFGETLGAPIAGMQAIIDDLAAAGVPMFGITNFSHEFFVPVRANHPRLFGPMRDIIVSGEERLVKPDAAIYRLAERRFGLPASAMLFVDDRAENIAGAEAVGMAGHLFRDAETLRRDLMARELLPA